MMAFDNCYLCANAQKNNLHRFAYSADQFQLFALLHLCGF